jgi:hypothetical protein
MFACFTPYIALMYYSNHNIPTGQSPIRTRIYHESTAIIRAMANTLREELNTKPILLRFDATQPKEHNGMLSLNEKQNFEFTWNGVGKDGRFLGEWNGGYVAFDYIRPGPVVHVLPDQIITYPPEIVYGTNKELVSATVYDRLKIKFQNIFTGVKHDIYKLKAIDLLEEINRDPTYVNDLQLEVFIGGSSKGSHFPMRAEYELDTLVIILTGNKLINLAEVDKMVDVVTKVIALYTGTPVDPTGIELGMQPKSSAYNYAYLDHSKPYEYNSLPRKAVAALDAKDHAGNFIDSIVGALKSSNLRELGVWFSYTEADHKKYYLDTIMSILLSCAESVFYLLPERDTSKREKEFDDMLIKIDQIEIKPPKLKKFISDARSVYIDPVNYQTKILQLIKYAGLNIQEKDDLSRYLNQLRNSLMHGTEPNWDYIVDKDRKPLKEVNVIRSMRTLSVIVSSALKKHLKELGEQ